MMMYLDGTQEIVESDENGKIDGLVYEHASGITGDPPKFTTTHRKFQYNGKDLHKMSQITDEDAEALDRAKKELIESLKSAAPISREEFLKLVESFRPTREKIQAVVAKNPPATLEQALNQVNKQHDRPSP